MANLQKNHFDGKRTESIHPNLPPGKVSHGEKFVRSKVLNSKKHKCSCYISGRLDVAMTFDDGTYGIIDFKTGRPKDESNELYKRQLAAYAFALENPEKNALHLTPVSKIGLIYFPPVGTKQNETDKMLYETEIHLYELERNDKEFLKFLGEALDILKSPTLPDADPDCIWCNYHKTLQSFK